MSDANMELRTIKEVLDFAIEAEVKAAQVYRALAASAATRTCARCCWRSLMWRRSTGCHSRRSARGDLSLFARETPVVQLSVPGFVPELSPR